MDLTKACTFAKYSAVLANSYYLFKCNSNSSETQILYSFPSQINGRQDDTQEHNILYHKHD